MFVRFLQDAGPRLPAFHDPLMVHNKLAINDGTARAPAKHDCRRDCRRSRGKNVELRLAPVDTANRDANQASARKNNAELSPRDSLLQAIHEPRPVSNLLINMDLF